MIGFLPTPIPAVQTVGGVARNEDAYDTELEPAGTNLLGTKITNFANYTSFATVTVPQISKQENRDTSLSGSGASGLPQGMQLFAYAWSCEIHAMDADLATFTNRFVPEQMNRLRRLSSSVFRINQTNAYITTRLVDLVSYEDSQNIQTTHGGTTVMMPDVGDRKGKSLTSTQRYASRSRKTGQARVTLVRNSPYVLQPQQNFRVTTETPQTSTGATFLLTVPLAVVHKFRGIMVRGIS